MQTAILKAFSDEGGSGSFSFFFFFLLLFFSFSLLLLLLLLLFFSAFVSLSFVPIFPVKWIHYRH